MNNTMVQRMKLISENYENMVTGLTDIYRLLLINILKNNQVTVDPNATLSQAWELAEPYVNDSYLKASVLGLLEKPSVVHILFAWDWVDTSVKLYGGGLVSQIGTYVKKLSGDKDSKKHWLQVFNEKFNDIVESTMKAYSEYYKRKLKEIPNYHTSPFIEIANFKELLDLFEQTFPHDRNLTYGKNLDLYRDGALPGFGGRMRVIEAISGVETFDQKANDDFDVKVKHNPEVKVIPPSAKELQDFFEKILVFLQDDSGGFENSDVRNSEKQLLLTQIEKTLAKQRHRVWDVCLLKLAKASLRNDTLEVFGVVLTLLEFVKNPEVTSILPHENVGFNKSIAFHLNRIKTRISDFYTSTGPGDKVVYRYLNDFFTYLY
jgi:DNA-binding ferritin-like protein (Dps family)